MERGESQTGNLGVKNGSILFLLALVVGCGAPDGGRADADALSQVDAAHRSAMVGDVAYELFVDLTNSDGYTGRANIAFKAVAATRPLTLDFSGGTVDELEINGKRIDADYNGAFIALPAGAIVDGENEVRIAYRRPYSTDGSGLYRFVDPEDDRPFVYSYLWPYYANRLFPAFDQPNLKATYELTVRAPRDWTVVSAARETSVETEGHAAVWTFPPTERFSTYIFSLHAGPYTVWEDRAGDVPIRLFARQSLAPHVPVEEWLDVTRRGLAFYGDYFDIPYPFHKYCDVRGKFRPAWPVHAVPARGPRERHPARDGPHVVRQSRHQGMVERALAERELRDVHSITSRRRGNGFQGRVAHVFPDGQAERVPRGRPRHDPPDRGPRPQHRGLLLRLRQHHVRQGCVGAETAGPLHR
jgi:aminopeptidase N